MICTPKKHQPLPLYGLSYLDAPDRWGRDSLTLAMSLTKSLKLYADTARPSDSVGLHG